MKRPRSPFLLATLLTTLFALLVHAESLVICGSCGTEASGGAKFCSHCGAALSGTSGTDAPAVEPAPSPANPAAPAAASSVDIAAIGGKAAQDCVLAGRKQVQANRPDIARVLYMNALAIAGIDPAVLSPAQGEKLQEEIHVCDEKLSMIRAECPACQGSGRRSLQVTSLGGSTAASQTTSVSSGIRCASCNGTGKTMRRRTVGERKTALGQGTQAAETTLRSLGFVQEGNAWIPQELVPALDLAQRCRLRRAAAAPCPDCQGFGLTDCRKCGATGYIPCKAKGCENGWIVDEPLNQLDSKSVALKARKPCPMCKGTALVPCPGCSGRGALTCSKCEGTGRRSLCHACGGEGSGPCPTCRGSGTAKTTAKSDPAPCPTCNGTGKSFCKTCHGEGYGR